MESVGLEHIGYKGGNASNTSNTYLHLEVYGTRKNETWKCGTKNNNTSEYDVLDYMRKLLPYYDELELWQVSNLNNEKLYKIFTLDKDCVISYNI